MDNTQQKPQPEIGQVWSDNDRRTKGSGEFTIIDIIRDTRHVGHPLCAVVQRDGRKARIRVDRLLKNGTRGYTYIGRSK